VAEDPVERFMLNFWPGDERRFGLRGAATCYGLNIQRKRQSHYVVCPRKQQANLQTALSHYWTSSRGAANTKFFGL